MKKIILLAMLLNILACDNTTESSQVDEHKQNLTFNNAIEKLKSNHKEEGYQILITLANNGDMKAENELGRIYQFSVLGEKNCDKSSIGMRSRQIPIIVLLPIIWHMCICQMNAHTTILSWQKGSWNPIKILHHLKTF